MSGPRPSRPRLVRFLWLRRFENHIEARRPKVRGRVSAGRGNGEPRRELRRLDTVRHAAPRKR